MSLTVKSRHSLKPQKELRLSTFLMALAVASAFFVPFIISGKGYFVFFGDFNVQQIPFYKMCHAAVKGGNIKWNFSTDLGVNFIGSYSFYLLGSPFFWLTIPFPNSFVPYLMGPLLILKFACAAFTAYLYIRRFTKTPHSARLGAFLYAFSGFSVYNIFFNHFHEAIIIFPLLLLSMEYLITENKRGVFALTVALSAVINYFFFFGMAVFCIIYYFVRVGMGAVKFKLSRLLWLGFEAVLGVLMSTAMLLPAVMAILENSRISEMLLGWDAIMYGKEQIYLNIIECFFFPPDLPARPVFFPRADVKWSSLGGWLPLFGMTGVITWFVSYKKNWIKRILAICAFMALVPILNSAFYAFNSAYYARWFYMPILIMSLATVLICENKDADVIRGFKYSAVFTVVLALVIGFYPRKNDSDKLILGLFTESDTVDYFARYWITVLIAVISLVLLAVIYVLSKDSRLKFIKRATALVCVISIAYSAFFIYLGRNHSYDVKKVVIDSLIEGNVSLDGDKDTFRIDTFSCSDNTGMFLGYNTINAFHSIVPPSIMDFYDYLGIQRDVASRPDTSYPAVRSLLSVKYLLDMKGDKDFLDEDKKPLMSGYEYIKTENGYYVYQNKNYIGYGFSYDYAMDKSFCCTYQNDNRAKLMLKAVLLNDEQMKKYNRLFKNLADVTEPEAEDLVVYDDDELSENTLNFDTDETDESDASKVSSGTSASATSKTKLSESKTESSDSSETLKDKNEEGDTVSLVLSDEEMAKDCERLAKTSATSFKTDNDGFTAEVYRSRANLVFFSVPYDEGWSATVNGEPVEIEKVNEGFMAVLVPAGVNTIRFDYTTPGLDMGLYVTGSAFLVFVIYFIIGNYVINKRNTQKIFEPDEYDAYSDGASDKTGISTDKTDNTEPSTNNYKSILDGLSGITNLNYDEESGIENGFKIDFSAFDDDSKKD